MGSSLLPWQYNIYPVENLQNMMEFLLDNIPVYNRKPLNWYSPSEDDNVLQDTNIQYEAELDDVLQFIVKETEQEIYKDTVKFEKVKHNFETFFDKAQMWERFLVICSWLGLLDLIILIILIFYTQSIVFKIIAGLEIVQKYNIDQQVEAFPTDQIPIFTLPPNFSHEEVITPHNITISTSTIIVIILICLLVCMSIYHKCKYRSSVTRVCFPVYPLSKIVWGKYHIDIFIEVTNTTTCQTLWAHLTKVPLYPSQLYLGRKVNSNQMNMSKFCCIRQLEMD